MKKVIKAAMAIWFALIIIVVILMFGVTLAGYDPDNLHWMRIIVYGWGLVALIFVLIAMYLYRKELYNEIKFFINSK